MRTVNIFLGVDMRLGHKGLTEVCKKNKIKLSELEDETAVVFISRSRLHMKCYSYNGVLSHIKAPDPRRPFDLNAIDYFPMAFSKNGTMDYSKALLDRLEKRLKAAPKETQPGQV